MHIKSQWFLIIFIIIISFHLSEGRTYAATLMGVDEKPKIISMAYSSDIKLVPEHTVPDEEVPVPTFIIPIAVALVASIGLWIWFYRS
ncbi:hypothetical protein [Hazenella coriacea]|uniref:Uncharacterized protein n=1 Tax=Hazenella coriacea TaxID=1179467 RepID=A0A4R3L9N7_9BACL|nr:hypothetical protein [Hazenella coriacea]TCS95840.1 hypothetical protein EDD58_102422 [Hazenella coriacea]